MPYQYGTIGPIDYAQDNSGVRDDTRQTIIYTPEQYGAPPGAQIIPGTVQQQVSVSRGLAYIENLRIRDREILFDVFTQAANDSWFFGWHSGSIVVSTSFTWFYSTDRAVTGGERFFSQQGPPAPTRSAPAWLTSNYSASTEPGVAQRGAAVQSGGAGRTVTGRRGTPTPARRVGVIPSG
jgi:hypothetical protein